MLERAETDPVLSGTRAPTTPVPKVGHGAASWLLKEASEEYMVCVGGGGAFGLLGNKFHGSF